MTSLFDGSVGHVKNVSFGLGIIGFCGCLIGWFVAPRDFFVAYLFGHFFFLGLSLGSLALLMIHHLTAGDWGYAVRRFLESAVGKVPLLACLVETISYEFSTLSPWETRPVVSAAETLQIYLNPPGFVLRTAIVFAVWIIMARQLLKWSAEQDVTVSLEPTRKMRTLSGPGLVIYPVTMTFAAVDWLMSMEADWYSTMFPVLICIGQVLSALALVILLLAWAARSSPLGPLANEKNFHKLGNLLLAFTMMWAYLAFGQLLVIWSGNLPHEISWYLHRISGGWRWIAIFIALFHFFVPFFLLLMRAAKQRRRILAGIGACVLAAHIVAVWWTIAPGIYTKHFYVGWLAPAAFLGIGGIYAFAFLKDLANLRAAEEADLDSYGWIDRNSGTVRIPIDRAMQLLLERGLPDVGTGQTPLSLMQSRPGESATPPQLLKSP